MSTSRDPSPWHEGERRLQAALGVAERMESVGRRVIRDFMPEPHRELYARLPFVVFGSVDGAGRPWAGLVEGPPGFVHSPDPRTLRLDRPVAPGDPAREGIADGSAVGLLGIEFHTRRRNRVNGRVQLANGSGFSVRVEHAFGNCPRYIQPREVASRGRPAAGATARIRTEHLPALDAAARAMITATDTFFVASYVDRDGDPAKRSVDVSHRGGRRGFIGVDGDRLTIPDFAGNLHFNTLGNLVVNPRAGLLFVDFESGDVLQVSGATEIALDDPGIEAFPGAERLWHLRIESAVRRKAALALRLRRLESSP